MMLTLRRCRAAIVSLPLALVALLLDAPRAVAIDLEPVMLQYQAVPGTTGFFHAPSITVSGLNNSRKVVTWGGWPGNPFSHNGIFIWENGVLTDLLRNDDVQNAPGIGQPVVQTQPGFLDHNGNVAAPASFGVDQDDVNYIGPNRAGLAFINRVGGADAPGNTDPWEPFVSVKGNNNGQMVFYGRVGNNDLGLWRGTNSANLVRLVQEDVTLIPNTAFVVEDASFETPCITSTGVALFDVGYGPSGDEEAVLVGTSDANLQVVARTNYLDVPGLPAGTKFTGVQKEAINNAGHIVMGGDWGAFGNSGLFTTARGLLEPVVLSNITNVPGVPGEKFDWLLSSVTISGNDDIFFTGESDVSATDGVYKWSNGVLSALATEGQAAPGANSTFKFFNGVHTNAAGDMMFVAELADENVGLWYVAAGTTTLVRQLITGMNVDVLGDGTDIRPIAELSMPGTFGGPQGGGQLRFNDHGDFIVELAFEAGVNTRPLEGIYISSVIPEPTTLALASLAAVACIASRRR
ncbi:DUF7453 family protein [Lacipirellula sp.]|uniref:DUF7453 family protein n=1 Tax=Lacipirellula sp. TaxID=2691419 RepID=UPI003D149A2C